MKNLSYEDLIQAPSKVQFVYLAATRKIRLGSKILEEAIKEHPEYFTEEIEQRNKHTENNSKHTP